MVVPASGMMRTLAQLMGQLAEAGVLGLVIQD